MLRRISSTSCSAARLSDGYTHILTTNFDTLIERARHESSCDRDLSVWSAGSPFTATARLLKLHGSADRTESLRHSLRTVNEPLPSDVVRGLRALTSNVVVVLGYAGADFDVLEVLNDPGNESQGTVYWLERPGAPTPPGAVALALRRDVRVVSALFDDLLLRSGFQRATYAPDGRHIWPHIDVLLERLSPSTAFRILLPVLYQARVAQNAAVPVFNELKLVLGKQKDPSIHRLYHQAVANESQFIGGTRNWLRAARHFAVATASGSRLPAASNALDALEQVGHGLLRPAFLPFAPVHLLAFRAARGPEKPLFRFRWAPRDVSIGWVACRSLARWEGLVEMSENDTYLEAVASLRMALARARLAILCGRCTSIPRTGISCSRGVPMKSVTYSEPPPLAPS